MYGASTNAQKVEAIFVQMDKDKDGKLNLTELSDLLKDTVGGDVETSAQEILKKLRASDVTLPQLGQLYASAATDESARTWLRSVDGDYAKMPYSPKFSTTGSHRDAASMSEAIFATCDKDGDGYLQGEELLVFLQACEKGSPNADSATRRIQELHSAIGPGVTGLEISLLKSMFADPKRFKLPSRYHATTFDNLAVAPAQKNLERLQKMMAEAKQALTEADDVANPAESEAKRKEEARDEATQIFEKADAEAKRQVELADNSVQECIVRIYGALAEKARQEMEAAQAKAASCRAVANAANDTAETERKAGEAKAASCKNKAWDASVNWLDMKIKKIEEEKASLEATLKSDNKKNAATEIQREIRGMQARRQVKQIKVENKAATQIQARFRGARARSVDP